MTHTDDCRAAQQRFDEAAAEFDSRWPASCAGCGGWGGKTVTYDPSPAGVALSPGSMRDFSPCPFCRDGGVCPRCAGPLPESEADPAVCPACGWDEARPEGRPEPPECWCQEF